MEVEDTGLSGLKVLIPPRHGDNRGFFSESWNKMRCAEAGIHTEFVQDNHSLSEKAGTVRGLHYQSPPHSQGKLVRCGRGVLYDVAVDARRGSPTYGQSFGIELSFENGRQLYVPEGFLHGFVTLVDDTEIIYKCSDYYTPEADGSVHWLSCGIDWPDIRDPQLSDKDKNAEPFSSFEDRSLWEFTE
ncbi:MAG: dTDP-4-dehydrorhamnose 3,5-epimerase [Pseudomonadota bacterium]